MVARRWLSVSCSRTESSCCCNEASCWSSESPTHVTFESDSGGITLRMRVARAQIRSIERQVVEGTGYCVIPLCGAIGDQVTAAALKAALAEARRAGAEYVILQIDSPGGSV